MSVNRLQTTKPLLAADAAALRLDVAALNATAGVVVGSDSDAETLRAIADLPDRNFALLAHIEPIDAVSEEDLNRLLECGVDGIVLSGCRGRADIQRLDVMLQVAEAAADITPGRTRLYAEYGEAPEGLLSPQTLRGSSARLEALIFNGEALARSLGCKVPVNASHHRVAAPIVAGRANVVLRACEARVPAYELLTAGNDEAATTWALSTARDNGFASVVCRSIDQLMTVSGA